LRVQRGYVGERVNESDDVSHVREQVEVEEKSGSRALQGVEF
jgi:hypothetical protein